MWLTSPCKRRKSMESEEEFLCKVEEWVLRSVQQGAKDFEEILCKLPGVYPPIVLVALQHLGVHGRISHSLFVQCSASAQNASAPCPVHPFASALPVPHPLDYAWRFSHRGSHNLMQMIERFVRPTDSVVMLGTPGLVEHMLTHHAPYEITVLDTDPLVIERLKVLTSSIAASAMTVNVCQEELPEVRSRVVAADPPWYPEHRRAFAWAASAMCEVGGNVLLCFPPSGTRPGVTEEWNDLFRWAGEVGLSLVEKHLGVVPYVSPYFERNALAQCKVRSILSEWRCADVAHFRKIATMAVPRPSLPAPQHRWHEEVVGKVRFRLRIDDARSTGDVRLGPIIEGDVLPSVSRRHPLRQEASVWTCGNRIFKCGDTAALASIIREMG